jgi:hypothetical protein
MGSIPLVALQVRTPETPDMIGNYSRILQLHQMMQNAPLQQQALQQQVQGGQLDLQMKQQQARDLQALSAAMHEWGKPKAPTAQAQEAPTSIAFAGQSNYGAPTAAPDAQTAPTAVNVMPDYDELINLAKKNGASFNAIKGLQTSILDMKEKASTIAKNDAQTGQDNVNAMKAKNGMVVDAMSGVLSLPDDQLAQGIMRAAQELNTKGALDPEHVQMAQQVAQSGDPGGTLDQLAVLGKKIPQNQMRKL